MLSIHFLTLLAAATSPAPASSGVAVQLDMAPTLQMLHCASEYANDKAKSSAKALVIVDQAMKNCSRYRPAMSKSALGYIRSNMPRLSAASAMKGAAEMAAQLDLQVRAAVMRKLVEVRQKN